MLEFMLHQPTDLNTQNYFKYHQSNFKIDPEFMVEKS